jgi:acetyl esterase/lipase
MPRNFRAGGGFERPTTTAHPEGCIMDVRRRRVVRLTGLPSRARLRHALVPILVAGGLAGCSLAPPAGTAPLRYRDVIFPNLTITSGLTYGSAPDLSGNLVTLTLDMYQPAGDTLQSRPAIVLVHGGSFVGGSSTDSGVVKLAKAFAQRGYVAVSINYRLLGDKEKCGQEDPPSQACVTAVLAAQHDAQAAVRWLRANAGTYGVDPSRIAIEGTSAGAGTALAVGVNSGDVGDSGNPGFSSKVGAAVSISADFPHSLASTYFDPGDSPILMFNGTADTVVPFPDAVQTAEDLQKAGVPVVFEQLDGAGHVPFSTYGTVMITQSVYFCYYMLDLAHAAGQPPSAAAAFARQVDRMLKHNPALRRFSRSRRLTRDQLLRSVRR